MLFGSSELHILELSSQAQDGIKIPPGRIAGGAISLEVGQTADINIEFSGCDSVVRQGMNSYRLLPTLHAGEVTVGVEAISGRIVDMGTMLPLPAGAVIIVSAQQPDAEDARINRVVFQTLANPVEGTFRLCPMPNGDYDLVAAAVDAAGISYHATVTFAVPSGTDVGDIPLAPADVAATIEGQVTTTDPDSNPTSADIQLAARQGATPDGGSEVSVVIPVFEVSISNVATAAAVAPATCPAGTHCASYTLVVPSGNPKVGTFDAAGTTLCCSGHAAGSLCRRRTSFRSRRHARTELRSLGARLRPPVEVTAGASTAATDLVFTSCQAGM